MKYVLDAHTHTIVSGHAYSTIREMTKMAKEKGLELLCITEHAPALPGAPHEFYFQNLGVIDRSAYDVPLLLGAEVNLLDTIGTIDLDNETLAKMDLVIASIHPPCIGGSMTKEEATNSILKVMENPHVHIIGHPDDGRFEMNYDDLARVAKETRTLLEVNNSSLLPTSFRQNAHENYLHLLQACEKYGTHIILNSDAHVDTSIGRRDISTKIIEAVQFPEELIVNQSVALFRSFLT
ncbi:MAG: phosphatase [Eubacteriales bacterium]